MLYRRIVCGLSLYTGTASNRRNSAKALFPQLIGNSAPGGQSVYEAFFGLRLRCVPPVTVWVGHIARCISPVQCPRAREVLARSHAVQ